MTLLPFIARHFPLVQKQLDSKIEGEAEWPSLYLRGARAIQTKLDCAIFWVTTSSSAVELTAVEPYDSMDLKGRSDIVGLEPYAFECKV